MGVDILMSYDMGGFVKKPTGEPKFCSITVPKQKVMCYEARRDSHMVVIIAEAYVSLT